MPKVKIELDNLRKAYNGKVGCMCGCKGDYAYASKHVESSTKSMGYDVSDSVNDTKLKRRLSKLLKMIETGDYDELDIHPEYVYVEKDDRCTAVYFK